MTILNMKRNELVRPRSRRVLASNSSCSTQSDLSCSSTISRLAHEVKRCPTEPRRRIHFCENMNEYYENTQITKEDCPNSWYSQENLKSFKAETGNLARKVLRNPTAAQQEWMYTLLAAYNGLVQATTADDMQDVLKNCSLIEIDPCLLGLEKWILRPVVQDKADRRKSLYGFIRACNRDTMSSPSYRTKALRKASRELSRPSRLFAHHVALAASYGGQ